MDKAYYIAQIEQAIDRIRVGMGNLDDSYGNFAALAHELTQTAEWVEDHAPMKWAHQPKKETKSNPRKS